MPYKKEDLAYIAGVIDSDGCISINKDIKKYKPTIEIVQVQPEAINFMNKIFEGKIIKKSNHKNRKDLYRWRIQSRNNLKIFLEAILPFLKIKRKQAKIVINYCNIRINSIKNNGGNSPYTYSGIEKIMYENIKKLNL